MFHLGRTNKHLSKLIRQKEWKQAENRCKSHPSEARALLTDEDIYDGKFHTDIFPLHQACALHAPATLVKTLVSSHPNGVKSKDSFFGRLPLHVALQSGASDEVIFALVAYHPQGTREKDKLHRLPIHYAISNRRSDEVIELLLKSYPQATRQTDRDGWLPIHVACYNSVGSICTISKLLNEDPSTIVSKTKAGNTPAMIAKKAKDSERKQQILSLLDFDTVFLERALDMRSKKAHGQPGQFCTCVDMGRNVTCSICLEDLDDDDNEEEKKEENNETITYYSCPTCKNSFHKECILDWLKAVSSKSRSTKSRGALYSCPNCRESMISQVDMRNAVLDVFDRQHQKFADSVFMSSPIAA